MVYVVWLCAGFKVTLAIESVTLKLMEFNLKFVHLISVFHRAACWVQFYLLFETVLYADDTTLSTSRSNYSELVQLTNQEFDNISKWTNSNQLTLNTDKTELMIVYKNRYRKLTKNIQMYASGYKVNQVQKV